MTAMIQDIFLSYAREDASKAMELVRILEKEGWSVWWDRAINAGQDFELEIDMALSSARAVIVLWSNFSVASNWVRNEAREAKELNKLLPVRLDDSRIPLTFRSLSSIDLSGWPDNPSLVQLATFKSAVNKVLLEGVSDQILKKPDSSDELTLSVRVASRVAEMVEGKYAANSSATEVDSKLLIERCITDICVNLVGLGVEHIGARIGSYVLELANVLGAERSITTAVNFSEQSVSAITAVDDNPVSADIEQKVLHFVNNFCTAIGEHNLNYSTKEWPLGKLLCVPLIPNGNGRDFAWFLADTEHPEWTLDVQGRLLTLSHALHTIEERSQ